MEIVCDLLLDIEVSSLLPDCVPVVVAGRCFVEQMLIFAYFCLKNYR